MLSADRQMEVESEDLGGEHLVKVSARHQLLSGRPLKQACWTTKSAGRLWWAIVFPSITRVSRVSHPSGYSLETKENAGVTDQAVAREIAAQLLGELACPRGAGAHPLKSGLAAHHRVKVSYMWNVGGRKASRTDRCRFRGGSTDSVERNERSSQCVSR